METEKVDIVEAEASEEPQTEAEDEIDVETDHSAQQTFQLQTFPNEDMYVVTFDCDCHVQPTSKQIAEMGENARLAHIAEDVQRNNKKMNAISSVVQHVLSQYPKETNTEDEMNNHTNSK